MLNSASVDQDNSKKLNKLNVFPLSYTNSLSENSLFTFRLEIMESLADKLAHPNEIEHGGKQQ